MPYRPWLRTLASKRFPHMKTIWKELLYSSDTLLRAGRDVDALPFPLYHLPRNALQVPVLSPRIQSPIT
jgi:hypothetical protein